jgi:hypothetical protein
MEWTINQVDDPRHIVMKVSGRFTVQGCRIGIAELAKVKDPLTPLLFDDRAVDFDGLSDFDLMELGGIIGEYGYTFAYSKIAVLVAGEHARSVAEKWRRVTDGASDSLIAVFEDEPAAIAWLAERSIHDTEG